MCRRCFQPESAVCVSRQATISTAGARSIISEGPGRDTSAGAFLYNSALWYTASVDNLEARTRRELTDIVAALTQLTGLPSRWSGRVELVPDAESKGRKRPICDIQLDTVLAESDLRWAILIHEALHSFSVGYNSSDFRQFRGWEEGVVEQLQRLLRPTILNRLRVPLADVLFHAEEEIHAFNAYIAAIESLRLLLNESEVSLPKQQFYRNLLALPISERPDNLLRVSFTLSQPQRGVFVSTFSHASSVLKARLSR